MRKKHLFKNLCKLIEMGVQRLQTYLRKHRIGEKKSLDNLSNKKLVVDGDSVSFYHNDEEYIPKKCVKGCNLTNEVISQIIESVKIYKINSIEYGDIEGNFSIKDTENLNMNIIANSLISINQKVSGM